MTSMKRLNPKTCVVCGGKSKVRGAFKPDNPDFFGVRKNQEIEYGLCKEHYQACSEAFSPEQSEKSRRFLNVAIAKKMGLKKEGGLDS